MQTKTTSIKVDLNISYRKHVKYTVSKKSELLYYVRTSMKLNVRFLHVLRYLVQNGIIWTQCDQECQYQSQLNLTAETCKTHLWVANQKYFIMLGLLWSCTYDFSMFEGIWSKTGSFRKNDLIKTVNINVNLNITDQNYEKHTWVANQKYFIM